MLGYTINQIAQITGGVLVGELPAEEVHLGEFVIDSREVHKGDVFVAIKSGRTDGHQYISAAIEREAGCCIAEYCDFYAAGPVLLVEDSIRAMQMIAAEFRKSLEIPVIGITGSVGKTTAKEMVAAVLSQKFTVHKNKGNLNNHMGVPMTISQIDKNYHEMVICEMGISGFGEMSVLAQIAKPDLALFTLIGHAHLEYLKDLDGVLKAKTEMLDFISDNAPVIINGDDPYQRKICTNHNIVSYGLSSDNCVYADNIIESSTECIECNIHFGDILFPVRIPGFGRHLLYAALEGAAVGFAFGLSPKQIARGIQAYSTIGRRFNVISHGDFTLIDDCYNANPDSVKSSIHSFAVMKGRKLFIFGEMRELGEETLKMHADIGRFAREQKIDQIICVGELTRSAASSFGSGGLYFENNEKLLSELRDILKNYDLVLVKASLGSNLAPVSEYIKSIMHLE